MSYLKDTPLGRNSAFIDQYTPSLLCPVPRWDARESLELDDTALPLPVGSVTLECVPDVNERTCPENV